MANIKFSGAIAKQDPELRYSPDGVKCVCNFSISLYAGKNKEGEYNPHQFIDVRALNDVAKAICKKFHHKDVITIEGYAQPREYTDKNGEECEKHNFQVMCTAFEEGDAFRPDAVHPGQASEF